MSKMGAGEGEAASGSALVALAAETVMPSTAALDATYATIVGVPRNAATLAVLTIAPPPYSRMTLLTALAPASRVRGRVRVRIDVNSTVLMNVILLEHVSGDRWSSLNA